MKPQNSLPDIEAEEDDGGFSDPYNIPDDFWENGVMEYHETKELISIRLDSSTLDYFKQRGRGYQARINSVLRHYVEAQKLAEAKEQGQRESVRHGGGTEAEKVSS